MTADMKLHAWCGVKHAGSFDPECLAMELLIASHSLPIEVVSDNNVLLGRLPLLEDGEHKISGFVEIVSHLMEKKLINYGNEDVAVQFYATKLTSLSLYLLFESKKNYEQITRPTISTAVKFPMQYNLTIELQRAIKARSHSEGFYPSRNKKIIEQQPGISKTHEKMVQETVDRQKALQTTQKTAFIVAKAREVYGQVNLDIEPHGPAYCLIAANMLLQTMDLPDPLFKSTVTKELAATAEWADSVTLNIKHDRNAYSFTNYVASFLVW